MKLVKKWRGLNLGFSGGAPFDPTKLSGLILWLRADKGVTQAGTVTAWADQSGTGNNFAPGTAPGFAAAGGPRVSQPAVTFNGTSQRLANATLAAPASKTIVLVAKSTATAAAQYIAQFSAGANGVAFGMGGTANKRGLFLIGNNNEADTTSNATTSWEAWVATDNSVGPLQALRVNGAAHALDINNSAETAATAGGSLGGYQGNSVFWGGSMWEVMCYNRVLSAGEISQVEAYISLTTGIF